MKFFHIATITIFCVADLFGDSTKTFTTDTDFSFFTLDDIVSVGTGTSAFLSLENRWFELSIGAPTHRHWFSMSADTTTHRVLLHGGRNTENPSGLNDFWIFEPSNNQWTQKSTPSPPPGRYGHKSVAIGSGNFLIFGGLGDLNYYNDTWLYDSNSNVWTNLNFTVQPSSRAHYSLTVDTRRNRVYLFGGTDGPNFFNNLWVYDISASSWSQVVQISTPIARAAAEIVYLALQDRVLLFGGHSGSSHLGDLWHFNPATAEWTQISQGVTRPVARRYFGFVYNEKIRKPVLLGGERATTPNISNDLWIYDFKDNVWTTASPFNQPPAARYGHSMSWPGYVFLFGGEGMDVSAGGGWRYLVTSSGSFVSNPISVHAPTGLYWRTLALKPDTISPETERKFQISASSDGTNWSVFAGPNGDPNQFFVYGGIPINIDWFEWQNKPHLRIRGVLSSDIEPQSPIVDSLFVRYNRPPHPPLLVSPPNRTRTNVISPGFSWNAADDPDGDTSLTYNLQLSTSPDFLPVYFSSAGISVLISTPGVNLYEGLWYWRVRAADPEHDGLWSGGFELNVDTTPPAAVSNLVAKRGSVNGQIVLSMNVPGDNGNSGELRDALCIVRFSSAPLINELDWTSADGEKQSPISHLPAGSEFIVNIDGLLDATTYYFNARIRDNAGNTGPLHPTSPSARTNAPPSVTLMSLLGGEVLGRSVEIRWSSSEPDGDTYKHFVFVSSNGGANFGFNLTPGGLGQTVTFYALNTRQFRNGANYVVKITATDEPHALSSSSISGIFSIGNPNESPSVQIIEPGPGSELRGHVTIYWSISDLNLADSHQSALYISSDAGQSFGWHFGTQTTFFSLNTREFPNSPNYLLKIIVSDDGTPSLSTQAVSGLFAIKNDNFPPRTFSLLYPFDKTYRSALDFSFVWEKNGDPNPEDKIRYKLIYSTNQNFVPETAVENIYENYYGLSPLQLIPDATYWWRVVAIDPFGYVRASNEIFKVYILNRFKTSTEDNFIICEVVDGMPPDGFLRIEKIKKSDYGGSIISANKKLSADPFIAGLDAGDVHRLSVCDINLNELKPGEDFEANVYLNLNYRPSQKTQRFIEYGNLRVALLDEHTSQWVLAKDLPLNVNGKSKSTINRTGYIFALAALSPKNNLMGLFSYPNPFDPLREKTRVVYTLTEESDVTLRIYNLTGDLILDREMKSGDAGAKSQPSGYQNAFYWDGRNNPGMVVANGMYILEIKTKNEKLHRKIGVVKR